MVRSASPPEAQPTPDRSPTGTPGRGPLTEKPRSEHAFRIWELAVTGPFT